MNRPTIDQLLSPKSVTVIGASNKPGRPGYLVMRNLLAGHFNGSIMPISLTDNTICDIPAYRRLSELPQPPHLAVIAIAASGVIKTLIELGKQHCSYAIILAAGIDKLPVFDGLTGEQQIKKISQKYGIRVLGGNSLGIQIPHIGLNASFCHQHALPGKVALVSQSSSIASTMLDWANHKGIGFSHFISLGETIDINFNELLDRLGRDTRTTAILLYINNIEDHRHFMSAARSAARVKPIIVIKSQGATGTTHSHERGTDVAYDAAFKRAGMLRVKDLHQLYAAFEILANAKQIKGDRLAIITNGGAPGVMAVDALVEKSGILATIEPRILTSLAQLMPSYWTATNPIDISGDSTPARFAKAVSLVLSSEKIDTLLIIHSPSAVASGEVFAREIITAITAHPRHKMVNVLTNWTGEESAYQARKTIRQAGFPTYRTPEGAIGALMDMVQYRRNQKLLQETPKSISRHYQTAPLKVRSIAQKLIDDGYDEIDLYLAAPLLTSYGLHTIDTHLVSSAQQAQQKAREIGFPVALKLGAASLTHKSDVGGVVLNLASEDEVLLAATSMLERASTLAPKIEISGLMIQKMAHTAGAQELRFAMHNDPTFGPVLYIGEGSSHWDLNKDTSVALPPLNMALARYMLLSALKNGKIKDRRALQALDIDALSIVVTQISHLIIDCPEIKSLDINPMLVNGDQISLLDVNIQLQHCETDGNERLAIRPYPRELEEIFTLKDGRDVLLRPIKAEDEQTHVAFNNSLSKEDRYKRFFGEVGQLSHEAMAKMTQIDFDREMAFIASWRDNENNLHTLGVVRAITNPDNQETEFAVVIRSDLQGQGLGRRLMVKMIDYCKDRQTQTMTGITLPQNGGMVALAKALGFKVKLDLDQGWIEMKLDLQAENK